MIAKGIHHVSFAVRDLEASCAFYEGLLGLARIERPDLGIAGAWLTAGDTQVHLIVAPEGAGVGSPPPSVTPIANHCAFAIDGYEQALARLTAQGRRVVETRPEIGQLWVQDPDGNVIELIDPRGRGAGARRIGRGGGRSAQDGGTDVSE